MLQGYRTILINLVAVLASWLNTKYNIVLDVDSQLAIVTTIIAGGNIALRFLTKTPVFKKAGDNGTDTQVANRKTD